MKRVIAVMIGVGFQFVANVAWAEEGMVGKPSPSVIEQINLANKLIALGDERKDPLLLIAAARLQKSLSDEAVGLPHNSVKVPDVLERARKLAEGRKDLTGLVDDVAAMRSKSFREDCVGLHHNPVCIDTVLY